MDSPSLFFCICFCVPSCNAQLFQARLSCYRLFMKLTMARMASVDETDRVSNLNPTDSFWSI